jgi:hypothetical protein
MDEEMGEMSNMHEDRRNTYIIVLKGKELGKHWRTWKDNIKTDLKEIESHYCK